jgi:hypothetical protein
MIRRELLGTVGVDSGQLMVIDPGYIRSEWQEEGDLHSVKFWGQGGEDVAKILEEEGKEVEKAGSHSYKIYTGSAPGSKRLEEHIRNLSRQINKTVVTWPQTESTYEQACDLTNGPNHGGQLNYRMGHEGLGVVFSSGLGDGTYEVYAIIQDVPGWGERVTKVEIELIPDWEIEEYRKEEAE